jgi:UDP-glucose 4-epimerase
MRALITGGAGFIGTNLARRLAGEGWEVTACDDLSAGAATHVEASGARLVRGDVLDTGRLREVAAGHDVVFHLAAGAGVVASIEHPLENFRTNAEGTVSALWAAHRAGVPRFVFASSNAPLGANARPAREDALPRPQSPYGASKLAGEGYLAAFHEAYGMETVVTRFSNVYGPHSRHKTNAIPAFIRAVERRDPIVVYGDGEQTRDFVFVGDLCAGLHAAATVPAAAGETFQLGSGAETTVNEVLRELGTLAGAVLTVDRRPARDGEVLHSVSDVTKARRVLGLPAPTSLRRGLRATWDWFAATSPSAARSGGSHW